MSGAPAHPLSRCRPEAPLPFSSQAAPVAASPSPGTSVSSLNPQKPSESNKGKILLVAQRFAYLMMSGNRPDHNWFNHCFQLARAVDYAVSHNDIPVNARDLPAIIKQVYQHKGETFLLPAIMILMIAAKNACRNNWFLPADSEEILAMANEISSTLSTYGGSHDESNSSPILSDIMSRFYPQLKLVRLLGVFEVKSGYDILVADIYIPRSIGSADRIRLFVFQADNTETSSCIISPQQVNFLINGKGVERRTNVSQDAGPQFPTDITKMLKYGMNLFQAVGSFSGNYIIALAVANLVDTSGIPQLQDYTQNVVQDKTLDSEIIEGPSRISLSCPISFKRIKTPVKGHHCNHHQCFDYESYMDINKRKPTWRCPHCNQSVTYVDIRMDRLMLKILGEAGEGVSDVIISADGSWKIVEVQQVTATHSQAMSPMGHQSSSTVIPSEGLLSSSPDIVDLTIEDLEDDTLEPANRSLEGEDKKSVHGTSVSTGQSPVSGPMAGAHISVATVGDMSRVLSGFAPNLSTSLDARRSGQVNANPDPAGVNLANPLSYRGVYPAGNPGMPAGPGMRPSTASTPYPSQPVQTRENPWRMHHFQNSVLNNEFGRPRLPHPANHPSPSLEHLHAQLKRARIGGSAFQSSRLSDLSAPSIPHAATQAIGSQRPSGMRPVSDQHIASSIHRPSLGPRTDTQTLNIRSANLQPHQTMSQIANSLPRTYHQPTPAVRFSSPNNTGLAVGNAVNQQSGLLSAKRGPQMPILQIGQTSLQTSRLAHTSQPTTDGQHTGSEHADSLQVMGTTPRRSDGSPGISGLPSQSQQEWRPTGRMRGSLSGPAYSAALSHYASPPPHLPTRPVTQAAATNAAPSTATSTEATTASVINLDSRTGNSS